MKNFCLIVNSSLILFYGTLNLMFSFSSEKAIATEAINENGLTYSISNKNREKTKKKPKFRDRGIPTGRRRGGTSRSDCPTLDKSLTAIVPGREIERTDESYQSSWDNSGLQEDISESESFLTRTVEEYPSFWIYVPELTDLSHTGEFILQDERDRDIYRTFFALPSKSGVLSVKLPPQPQNSLKIGQKYHWYVKIFCSQSEKSKYIYVDAWIERIAVAPKLKQQLNTDAERYQIFINNNLWHDAIDSLAKKQTNSSKYIEDNNWYKLLTTLGLSDLMNEDILDIKANFLTEQKNSKNKDEFLFLR